MENRIQLNFLWTGSSLLSSCRGGSRGTRWQTIAGQAGWWNSGRFNRCTSAFFQSRFEWAQVSSWLKAKRQVCGADVVPWCRHKTRSYTRSFRHHLLTAARLPITHSAANFFWAVSWLFMQSMPLLNAHYINCWHDRIILTIIVFSCKTYQLLDNMGGGVGGGVGGLHHLLNFQPLKIQSAEMPAHWDLLGWNASAISFWWRLA